MTAPFNHQEVVDRIREEYDFVQVRPKGANTVITLHGFSGRIELHSDGHRISCTGNIPDRIALVLCDYF